MTTEHTPPPWTARLGEIFSGNIPVASVAERKLPDGFTAFRPADSYLIAAAPELLDAVLEVIEQCDDRPEEPIIYPELEAKLRAAIAKAHVQPRDIFA